MSTEDLRELRRHPNHIRYTLQSAFFWLRSFEISDNLIDLLIQIIHRIGVRAERKVEKEILKDLRRVSNKYGILFNLRHFLLTWLKKQGIDDALIQPYSGHESRKSLEVYSKLAITDAQYEYNEVINRFPI